MAVTNGVPLQEWYTESTSEWTLDYPPFFAWLEWCLGKLAGHVDSGMLSIQSEPYASWATIVFQRVSVIALDAVYAAGAWLLASSFRGTAQYIISYTIALLTFGLFLVDRTIQWITCKD